MFAPANQRPCLTFMQSPRDGWEGLLVGPTALCRVARPERMRRACCPCKDSTPFAFAQGVPPGRRTVVMHSVPLTALPFWFGHAEQAAAAVHDPIAHHGGPQHLE